MPHDHHDHSPIEIDEGMPEEAQVLSEALRELLIEKGLFTADDVTKQVAAMSKRTPGNGAAIVARAWTDPDYKSRLLSNGPSAAKEMGFDIGAAQLLVVENTPDVHNVIVCTLCSCYPVLLLGPSPEWYKSKNYRKRTVNEPRAVLKEFGTELPDSMEVRVHDSTADMRYMVLPERPQGTEDWTEEKLAELVNVDALIGVSTANSPV
jgi:nitrile hydratase subunit alpha